MASRTPDADEPGPAPHNEPQNDPQSDPNPSADTAPESGAPVEPAACDYELAEPDAQEALWLEFQRQRQASCPVTGAEITLALSRDPAADGGGGGTEVSARCSRCGRQATFRPPDAADIYGWAE